MDRYYKKRSDPWSRSTAIAEVQAAVKLVSDKRYNRCLDIGTGLGYFVEAVSPLCDTCLAIDISDEAIKKARLRLPESTIEFKLINVRKFEPKNKFDLIICGDVLYYLGDALLPEEFTKLITKISSWIDSGGRILLTHEALPSRNEDWFWKNYVEKFKEHGLRVEKQKKFQQGKIIWLHVVLTK